MCNFEDIHVHGTAAECTVKENNPYTDKAVACKCMVMSLWKSKWNIFVDILCLEVPLYLRILTNKNCATLRTL